MSTPIAYADLVLLLKHRIGSSPHHPRRQESQGITLWRKSLLAPLHGRVLELSDDGHARNLDLYPSSITHLTLIHLSPKAQRHAIAHAQSLKLHFTIEHIELTQLERSLSKTAHTPLPEHLGLPFDALVSSLALCKLQQPQTTLKTLKPLLTEQARLVFLEHGAALEDSALYRWQRRLGPLWRTLHPGCQLQNNPLQALQDAGFHIEQCSWSRAPGMFYLTSSCLRGNARLHAQSPPREPDDDL